MLLLCIKRAPDFLTSAPSTLYVIPYNIHTYLFLHCKHCFITNINIFISMNVYQYEYVLLVYSPMYFGLAYGWIISGIKFSALSGNTVFKVLSMTVTSSESSFKKYLSNSLKTHFFISFLLTSSRG